MVLLAVIGITAFVYSIRHEVHALQQYIGIFTITIIGSATIILPVPAFALVFLAGSLKALDPFWIGVIAGIGATIGELTGYSAGFSGQAVIENARMYERLYQLTNRYGMITVFVLAVLPLPLFDFAGIAAGALKIPMQKFLLATLVGKVIKMWITAYAGAGAFRWVD